MAAQTNFFARAPRRTFCPVTLKCDLIARMPPIWRIDGVKVEKTPVLWMQKSHMGAGCADFLPIARIPIQRSLFYDLLCFVSLLRPKLVH